MHISEAVLEAVRNINVSVAADMCTGRDDPEQVAEAIITAMGTLKPASYQVMCREIEKYGYKPYLDELKHHVRTF